MCSIKILEKKSPKNGPLEKKSPGKMSPEKWSPEKWVPDNLWTNFIEIIWLDKLLMLFDKIFPGNFYPRTVFPGDFLSGDFFPHTVPFN